MQQKRRRSPLKFLVLLLVLASGSGIAVLYMTDIPAPTQTVEKELDAKAFLAGKPE